jgi:predicted nucleic acid-binding protein
VALHYSQDAHFDGARALWRDRRHDVLTTNHVIGETWTFLRRRVGHRIARRFVDLAEQSPRLTIHRVDEATEREAWEWLRRHDERVYSFVDATSFAVMRKLRILEALAFGDDFAAAGFVEIRP